MVITGQTRGRTWCGFYPTRREESVFKLAFNKKNLKKICQSQSLY